jgi:hypothetical protein
MGFAKRSIHPIRRVALIVLFCVTAPSERAYAMDGLSDSSQPKFVQTVYPHWWSPTAPEGEEFELPSGTKTCSLLKVRFVGQISMMVARAGPGERPHEASFVVEDNFRNEQYSRGKVVKTFFYSQYNDTLFGLSEINRKLGPRDYWFQDRNDANLVLLLLADGSQPETPVSYVCAFKEGEQVLLSYFLKRSSRRPWSSPHPW